MLKNLVYLNIASIKENQIEKFLSLILKNFILKMPSLEMLCLTFHQGNHYYWQKSSEKNVENILQLVYEGLQVPEGIPNARRNKMLRISFDPFRVKSYEKPYSYLSLGGYPLTEILLKIDKALQ